MGMMVDGQTVTFECDVCGKLSRFIFSGEVGDWRHVPNPDHGHFNILSSDSVTWCSYECGVKALKSLWPERETDVNV